MANPFQSNCDAQDNCDFDCAPSESQARQYMLQGLCAILTAVNGGGGGGGGDDTEILLLCDDQGAGVVVPFIRYITVPAGGGPVVVTNTTLDGTTPYVPSGTVSICTGGGGDDTEILTLCDIQNDGTEIPFIRYITIPSGGGGAIVTDTTLDGVTPYVVIGTVDKCSGVVADTIISETLCVQEDAVRTMRFITFSGSGTNTARGQRPDYAAQTFTQDNAYALNGAPIGFAGSSTPLAGTHSADNTKLYSADGTNIFQADIASGVLDSTNALAGFVGGATVIRGLTINPVTGDLWAISEAAGGNAAFYTVDVTTGVMTNIGITITGNLATDLGLAINAQGRVFVSTRNAPVTIREYDPNTFAEISTIYTDGAGILHNTIGLSMTPYNTLLANRATVGGQIELDLNGNVLNTFTGGGSENGTVRPNGTAATTVGAQVTRVTTIPADGSPATVVYYDSLGQVVDVTDLILDICCCDSEGMNNLGREILNVTDAAAVGLASIPVGAEGATIQVQVTATPGSAVRYFADGGTDPTGAVGYRAFDLSTIPLGIIREVFSGDVAALANFRAIGETAVVADLLVTYWSRK